MKNVVPRHVTVRWRREGRIPGKSIPRDPEPAICGRHCRQKKRNPAFDGCGVAGLARNEGLPPLAGYLFIALRKNRPAAQAHSEWRRCRPQWPDTAEISIRYQLSCLIPFASLTARIMPTCFAPRRFECKPLITMNFHRNRIGSVFSLQCNYFRHFLVFESLRHTHPFDP
jgi:hypothetical protein